MNIFLCCSKHIYDRIAPVKKQLEDMGHTVTVPNSYDEPFKEEEMKQRGAKEHAGWKSSMIRLQDEKIKSNDAILVLNLEKHGVQNYIGGATFLEIFKAWDHGKKVFLYNQVPDSIFTDELVAMEPVVIEGDLSKVM